MTINTNTIEGNVAVDPDLRYSTGGKAVMTLVIAHSGRRMIEGRWTDTEVSYFDVVLFGRIAEHAAASFATGDRVLVSGKLRQRNWVDKTTGEKRFKVEIVADSVAASLTFATTTSTKMARAMHPSAAPAGGHDLIDEEPW